MGNGLKNLFSNKNTVTVIGIIAVIFILYFAYNWRVNQAITPITVPYAKELIKPGTQITQDKIGTMEVPRNLVEGGTIISSVSDVVDKYSNADTIIPEGSLFYTRQVVKKEQLPSNIILNVKEGYVLYNMSVNTESTYGNSVYPGNYIDIYMKIVKKPTVVNGQTKYDNKMQLSKFISNIKVITVLDAGGNPVFENLDENRTPAMVIFAVPEEYYILLKKAEFLGEYEATLIAVPTNESLKENPGKQKLTSEELKNYINSITEWDKSMG